MTSQIKKGSVIQESKVKEEEEPLSVKEEEKKEKERDNDYQEDLEPL